MRGQKLPFAMRELEATAAKEDIARRAGDLLADGEAVLLDGGTTTLALARRLVGRRLTVMTLSLHHAGVLAAGPDPVLMLPGGTARPGELTLEGPLTEASIAGLRFDTAILGGCGISPSGDITTHELAGAAVMRAAIASARRTVLLADATKFARTALVVVAPLTAIDVVVTDPQAPPEDVAHLRRAGIEVLDTDLHTETPAEGAAGSKEDR